MALDCSVVLMDVVECLFDRDNSTAPMHGFTLPIDRKLPEYCEVRKFYHKSVINTIVLENLHLNIVYCGFKLNAYRGTLNEVGCLI